jgi:hypothetical protein
MDNTTNTFTNPFTLPPVVQISLPLSVARNLLTLLEECESTPSMWPEDVQAVRREYTNEMIAHGIIRPSECSVMTPDEDATQGEYDDDNAWLRSAGWGEM